MLTDPRHRIDEFAVEMLNEVCTSISDERFTTVPMIAEFLVYNSDIPYLVDCSIVVFFTTKSELVYISNPYLDLLIST